MSLNNPTVLGVAFAVLVVLGVTVAWFVGQRARTAEAAKHSRHAIELCEPLGLSVLPWEHLNFWRFACVGDYRGSEVLLFYVPTRRRLSEPEPRVDVMLNTGLLKGLKGQVNTFSTEAKVAGPDGARLQGYVTPAVREAGRPLNLPCLQGMAMNLAGTVLDMTIRERWRDGWDTVVVYATLPKDASSGDVRAALDSMLRVRDALAQEVGE